MIAYVFPGQGSQNKGMGRELFDEFSELTAKVDKVLGYSIKELCLENPNEQLGQTQYTQPALYVVNALSYFKTIKETGKKPDYVAGHSLGEYNALLAAGAFSFEEALKLVKKRGELMGQATGGGMAAVIGLSEDRIKEVLRDSGLESIDIANYNTPSQIVVSGPREEIERAKPFFEAAGAKLYSVLKVSGAFHSRYMEQSKIEFNKYLDKFKFAEMNIPVISNFYARPYRQEEIKKTLAEQITGSVKWTESIRYLMGKGEMQIEQIGPGTILTGLVKNIQKEAEPLVIADEEKSKDLKNAEKLEIVERMATAKKDTSAQGEIECQGNARIVGANIKKKKQKEDAGTQETKLPVATPVAIEEEKDMSRKNGQKVMPKITASSLGDAEFKKEYKLKYAYMTGSMYKGIASDKMVVNMGKSGMMGFLGTGGLSLEQIEESIKYIQKELNKGEAYGLNLLYNPAESQKEEDIVDLYLRYAVKNIEAAAFMSVTPALVKYRLRGLTRDAQGTVSTSNKIMAKISRPEVAEAFLSPAPERIVRELLEENKISPEQAELAIGVPMADDLCVEADSGGHTDHGVAYALMPAMLKLKDEMMKKYGYSKKIRVGAAGGIGTPEAAAAAFIMGADFVLTGSINQCTVEAGTSDAVKDLLQQINVQDTEYAPAGDMFEFGAKVQVLKRGLFFPARANKLYELYRQYNSIDEIDEKTKKQIQDRYFQKGFDEVYKDVKSFYPAEEIEKAERNPKQKMALIFRWYFGYSTRLAMSGSEDNKVDYQVHCGPSLGAFNQWVKGTELEDWRNRNVDKIAEKLMVETAELLNNRFQSFF